MSDPKTGELLFYANSIQVWNRKHEPMVKGTGIGGFYTVPVPGSDQQYYLFNMAGEMYQPTEEPLYFSLPRRLYYHIIDMRLDGGLGGVVEDSYTLLIDTWLTEGIAVVPHENGRDYWLLAHEYGNSNYRIALITQEGISPFRTQSIGAAAIGDPVYGSGWFGSWGYIKPSPDGKKLAATLGSSLVPDPINLFDFDAASGALSNYIPIPFPGIPFGVSFSPDNSKLYVSIDHYTDGRSENFAIVYQYDLSTYTPGAIQASALGLISGSPYHSSPDLPFNSFNLQLGPDGRIYGANNWVMQEPYPKRHHLLVIDQPNKKGSESGVSFKYFDFGEAEAGWRLPNFIENEFNGLTPKDNPNIPCSSEIALKLYPNPTAGLLKIKLPEHCLESAIQGSVYNLLGQKMGSFLIKGGDAKVIDMHAYPAGTYYLVIYTSPVSEEEGSRKIGKKIIKL